MSTGGPAAVNNGGPEPDGPTRLGGRYELGEPLGVGGMAVVRLATDVRLARQVAVKMLRGELAESPAFQARFRREARAAAALDHPAVVSVYDAGEDTVDGMLAAYIVMEYVPGQTLRDSLHAGPLDPRRALEITADVLDALETSHRRGIVHRDIKPANVMVTPSGEVKVMDFGVARALTDASTSVTQTAAVIGTAQYLSPEQARGETVDARSDLYSTGCLLYELLTGRPPFQGDSAISVAYQHVRETAPAPSTVAPGLPTEIDAVVMSALAKRTEERYQSAEQMRAAILDLLAGRLPALPAAGLADAATAVVGRASGADGGAWTTQETPAVDLSTAGPGRGDRRRRLALLVAAAVVLLAGTVGAFTLNALGEDQPVGQQADTKVAPRDSGRAPTAPSDSAAFDVSDTTSSGREAGTGVQPRRTHPKPSDDPSTNEAVEPSPEPEQTEPTQATEPESSPSPTPEESTSPSDSPSETPPPETQEPAPSTPASTGSAEPQSFQAGSDAAAQ